MVAPFVLPVAGDPLLKVRERLQGRPVAQLDAALQGEGAGLFIQTIGPVDPRPVVGQPLDGWLEESTELPVVPPRLLKGIGERYRLIREAHDDEVRQVVRGEGLLLGVGYHGREQVQGVAGDVERTDAGTPSISSGTWPPALSAAPRGSTWFASNPDDSNSSAALSAAATGRPMPMCSRSIMCSNEDGFCAEVRPRAKKHSQTQRLPRLHHMLLEERI